MQQTSLKTSGTDDFDRDLLNYVADIRRTAEPIVFSLPRIRLELVADSPGYADLCRRALVDAAVYATPDQRPLRLTVLDYERHPGMPRPVPPPSVETTQQLSEFLDPSGREAAYDPQYRMWQIFDRDTWTGVEALSADGAFPPWQQSFPLRNFMHWAYQTVGWRLVHAGTLGTGGKGVMLAGPGGAGKSGTTLSGIAGGLESVGDDYIALDLSGAKIVAYPLMRLMKQDPGGLARLGIEARSLDAGEVNWQGKYEFDFGRISGRGAASSLELGAILMPRIARTPRSSISRAPSRAAMLAFAPSNLMQLPGGWRASIGFTADVVRRLPAYYIDLGTDPAEIADTIGTFIAGGMR